MGTGRGKVRRERFEGERGCEEGRDMKKSSGTLV